MMNAKRVLIPVLMLAICAAILVVFRVTGPDSTSSTNTATRTPPMTRAAATQPLSTSTPLPSQGVAPLIPAVGESAPDFTLPSVNGGTVTLSDYRGQKNVVLLFYRTGG
jgi:cytochrome oxidase Cu insertion factor (SCO1/SenC/PrrC family)